MKIQQHTHNAIIVFLVSVIALSSSYSLSFAQNSPISGKNKPVVENYSTAMVPRSGIALGGIGTGSIELRKDGRFYNWSIFNNQPKGSGTPFFIEANAEEDPMASLLFFTVRYQVEGQQPQMKLLQINNDLGEGALTGMIYYFPWMEAVQNIEYSARFPFVDMKFSDPEMPFDIYLEAYSPFIPYDVKNSSLPLVYFNFKVKAKTSQKVDVLLIASLRNTVGYDHPERFYTSSIDKNDNYVTCNMSVGNVPKTASSYGQMSLTSMNGQSTYYAGWSNRHPYYEQVLRNVKLPDIDDTDGTESIKKTYAKIPDWMPTTNGRNMLSRETGEKTAYRSNPDEPATSCFSSVACAKTLESIEDSFENCFAFTWNFPNQYAAGANGDPTNINEGNYYNNYFKTAAEVAQYAFTQKDKLHKQSKDFLDQFFNSTMDTEVLEQINSQLNTFVTSGRLVKDGSFGIQEGLAPHHSWGPIATIDVSLYGSVPIIALFPELQEAMMKAHRNVQAPDGRINHGLYKSFHVSKDTPLSVSDRVDLPGQYIIMVARDYFWTNDKAYLKEMYPSLLKAKDYVLTSLDKNGDQMPDMEGHRSSYDNFPMYGLASYIQSQWLCAMKSLSILAEEMNDKATQKQALSIFKSGSKLMDKYLWNGNYYRLYNDFDGAMGADTLSDGCLTDQIVGQWAANQSGLGYLFNHDNIDKALRSILDMSYKSGFGLRNSSWPGAKYFTDIEANMWVDQGNTYWSGVELAFASFLIYENMADKGIELVKAVDHRYRKAGLYFDHQEFGGHYYRPMSAWSILNAMLGFSLNQGTFTFSPKYQQEEFHQFFATPVGYGHYQSEKGRIQLQCNQGTFKIQKLILADKNLASKKVEVRLNNTILKAKIKTILNQLMIDFGKEITVNMEDTLVINTN